jgi:hypothetical protein
MASPRRRSRVELARPHDLLLGVGHHLGPLRHPARRARDGEEHRKHLDREAHGVVDEGRVEVDVREEVARGEPVVVQHDLLELPRHGQQRRRSDLGVDLVGQLPDDGRAGIPLHVRALAESREVPRIGLQFLDELAHAVGAADRLQHAQHAFVRAAVSGARHRRARGRDDGVGIGVRAAGHARRRGGAVLRVLGIEDEQPVEGALEDGIRPVSELGHLEEHREEVPRVGQLVVGIHVGEPPRAAIGERRDRRHLADQPSRLDPPRLEVEHVVRVGVEGRERGHRAGENAHRARVVAEAPHETLHVLVQHGVHLDVARPHREVGGDGQLALDDEIRGLEVGAARGEVLDRVAAVAQRIGPRLGRGDLALAERRVAERRVVAHEPRAVRVDLDLGQIGGADGAVLDGERIGPARAVVRDRERVPCHARRIIAARTDPTRWRRAGGARGALGSGPRRSLRASRRRKAIPRSRRAFAAKRSLAQGSAPQGPTPSLAARIAGHVR